MDSEYTMEDSGFDSDQRLNQQAGENLRNCAKLPNARVEHANEEDIGKTTNLKALKRMSGLKKQMEKQRDAARRANGSHENNKGLKQSILSHTRLLVPRSKQDATLSNPDLEPLVVLSSDESEDEFNLSSLSKDSQREITQQLIQDGYNLNVDFDDEDLELKPPRPLHERCSCCDLPIVCSIQ